MPLGEPTMCFMEIRVFLAPRTRIVRVAGHMARVREDLAQARLGLKLHGVRREIGVPAEAGRQGFSLEFL